jgi:hypothetical protein
MRGRRRPLAGGLAAAVAISAFLALTVTNRLGRSTTTRTSVQVGAPRFTG